MESKSARFVFSLQAIWDLEDKRANELNLKNRIEETERYIWGTDNTRLILDAMFKGHQAAGTKRFYRNT